MHPAFGEAEVVEMGTGVRPAFLDNLPRIRFRDGLLHVSLHIARGKSLALEIRNGTNSSNKAISLNLPAMLKPRQSQQPLFQCGEVGRACHLHCCTEHRLPFRR